MLNIDFLFYNDSRVEIS